MRSLAATVRRVGARLLFGPVAPPDVAPIPGGRAYKVRAFLKVLEVTGVAILDESADTSQDVVCSESATHLKLGMRHDTFLADGLDHLLTDVGGPLLKGPPTRRSRPPLWRCWSQAGTRRICLPMPQFRSHPNPSLARLPCTRHRGRSRRSCANSWRCPPPDGLDRTPTPRLCCHAPPLALPPAIAIPAPALVATPANPIIWPFPFTPALLTCHPVGVPLPTYWKWWSLPYASVSALFVPSFWASCVFHPNRRARV